MNHYYKLFHLIVAVMVINPLLALDNLRPTKVKENIYAIVGSTGNRTKENLGNNATFGFVITSEGVVLIDSGATYEGAKSIHDAIKRVTNQPVIIVINTGGQDHRWLGNDYFKKLGAKLIASASSVEDQKARSQNQFFMLRNLLGEEGIKNTNEVYAEKTFEEKLNFHSGKTKFELVHTGTAHTPGDSFVWLPEEKVMFTGDIVYVERMLAIFDFSNSKGWMKAFETMASYKPRYLIPGHGHPTNLVTATKDTYDYLKFLRKSVEEFMANGGSNTEIRKIDQSKYKYLINFETLQGLNALNVYSEMELE